VGDELLTVRCACGWETVGTEQAVVTATIEHGLALHNMAASREEVLAMAVPAGSSDRQGERAEAG
jgi:predicted small metal-binding protein